MFLILNALITFYHGFLNLYAFALDSSYVCLNNSDQLPNLTIRIMERDTVTIIGFENTIFTITIFLKSLLVKAFAHNHFHGENLMTLRF